MLYLIKRLSSRINRRLSQGPRREADAFWAASDAAAAVMDVEVTELWLGEEELNAMLRSGELKSTDLARHGNVWVCLVDFPPCELEALKAARCERRRRMLGYGGSLLFVILGYAIILYVWF
ncbi:MAG: hypothetical protein IT380_24615 [Myxococcales bacterium]|nr:hypothetical protein [Myxococcales bacterium]